jgi:hypothetical protein
MSLVTVLSFVSPLFVLPANKFLFEARWPTGSWQLSSSHSANGNSLDIWSDWFYKTSLTVIIQLPAINKLRFLHICTFKKFVLSRNWEMGAYFTQETVNLLNLKLSVKSIWCWQGCVVLYGFLFVLMG